MLKLGDPVALHHDLGVILLHIADIRHHGSYGIGLGMYELRDIPDLRIYPLRHIKHDRFCRIINMIQKSVDIHRYSLEVSSCSGSHQVLIQMLMKLSEQSISLDLAGLHLFFIHLPLRTVFCLSHSHQSL